MVCCSRCQTTYAVLHSLLRKPHAFDTFDTILASILTIQFTHACLVGKIRENRQKLQTAFVRSRKRVSDRARLIGPNGPELLRRFFPVQSTIPCSLSVACSVVLAALENLRQVVSAPVLTK